jgi:arylsulfatase A-like enzyme
MRASTISTRHLALRCAACVAVTLVACGAPEPDSGEAGSANDTIAVEIDLTQPLRCVVRGASERAPEPLARWVQDDLQSRDAILRLPSSESALSFELQREGEPSVAEEMFRITVTSDSAERVLSPTIEGDAWGTSLADFDGDVVRIRFEKLVADELVWIAPRVRGRDRVEPAALGPLPRTDAPFNIVLYVVDTLRADRMSLYGHGRETSPSLTRMARRGRVFDNAYANGPSTLATMPSMFSSQHSSMLRAQLRPEIGAAWTFPELLRETGYRTGGFQANPWVNVKNGFDRGFETYEVVPGHYEKKVWKNPKAPDVHRRALAWLEALAPSESDAARQPFFLFVQTMDVHAPYEPPRRFRAKFPLLQEPEQPLAHRPIRMEIAKLMSGPLVAGQAGDESRNAGRYEAGIAYADDQFAALMRGLADRGLAERTIVFLTADHGEALGNFDDGTYLHGHSLHEELVRVPLVVIEPWRHGKEARRISRPVSVLDLAPTLLEIAGVDVPSDATGRSLFAPDHPSCPRAVQGELTDPPHHAGPVSEGPRPVDEWYVREGRWKLLGGPKGRGLFDLDADPKEVNDVSSEHAILTAYLGEIRRASVAAGRAAPDFGKVMPRADSDQRAVDEALRQLGYIE